MNREDSCCLVKVTQKYIRLFKDFLFLILNNINRLQENNLEFLQLTPFVAFYIFHYYLNIFILCYLNTAEVCFFLILTYVEEEIEKMLCF